MRSVPLAYLLTLLACGPNGAPERDLPVHSPGRSAQVVNATILANGCQEFGRADGLLAERAMYELVESCTSVPGGTAQFAATLQPGGQIEISAASGQPDVVPICILKHSLMHKVPLARPCRLDVKIEQTSVPMNADKHER